MTSAADIHQHITDLVDREHALREKTARQLAPTSTAELDDLAAIERELDQYWDLLRQREALRRAGRDPDQAHIRPQSVVENYEN
ncbi:MAG: DUF2630 family protein [Propionibacteriaceae bacterium]|jgi:hypothetical protein|nr:DUF2630 family protein [Propionibacteriaceae bacterium]